MTGRDPITLLKKEALRFPIVADLVDRAAYLTDEEIETAQVPLPWYRSALKQLRSMEQFAAKTQEMKSNMDTGTFFRHGKSPSIIGVQATFGGNEMWVKTFTSDLLLHHGTPVFFPKTGGMWVESAFCRNANVQQVEAQCRNFVETNLDSYKAAFNERQLALHPDAPMVFNPDATPTRGTSSASMRLAALGVTIT